MGITHGRELGADKLKGASVGVWLMSLRVGAEGAGRVLCDAVRRARRQA